MTIMQRLIRIFRPITGHYNSIMVDDEITLQRRQAVSESVEANTANQKATAVLTALISGMEKPRAGRKF